MAAGTALAIRQLVPARERPADRNLASALAYGRAVAVSRSDTAKGSRVIGRRLAARRAGKRLRQAAGLQLRRRPAPRHRDELQQQSARRRPPETTAELAVTAASRRLAWTG